MNSIDELQTVLDDTAQDIAQVVPNPGDWSKLIIYFFEELEDKTEDRLAFNAMLHNLRGYLSERLERSAE